MFLESERPGNKENRVRTLRRKKRFYGSNISVRGKCVAFQRIEAWKSEKIGHKPQGSNATMQRSNATV